jgi:hypothetical protein
MEYTNSAEEILNKNYAQEIIFLARRMMDQGRVSLSFMKGSLESYFIVSGIIAENNTNYEAKVSYKKSEDKFTTQCSCNLWNAEKPCHHTASLLLKFSDLQEKQGTTGGASIPLSLHNQEGVHVERYGTLVNSVHSREQKSCDLPCSNEVER